jgi:NAD(P)-dependent dehydrogenase (short-subunit alcohol dehydrogenase family)
LLFLVDGQVASEVWRRVAYASALKSFVKSVAREFAPAGVRVNAIVGSPLFPPQNPGTDLRSSEELAALADFLLSERSSYITGQTLDASGRVGRLPAGINLSFAH